MSRDGPKGAGGESCCVRQPCRKETPAGGMTRRLRRGRWGCRPEGGSTFFRSERKYQRKHAARRLREKALYCPFLKEGVRNVARSTLGLPTWTFVRARAHSYPLSKRARLFPPLPIAALAPAVGVGHTQPLWVRMLRRGMVKSAGPTASGFEKPGWPLAQAARPSVERRSVPATWQESTPDPRAARPVAERW